MSSLKTLLVALLFLLPAPVLAAGTPDLASPTEQLRTFATCAGRLRAKMEHQWLFSDPASDETAVVLHGFDEVIAAMLDLTRDQGVTGGDVIEWRLTAKMSQAALLQQATFGEGRQARYAKAQARVQLINCQQLLLG